MTLPTFLIVGAAKAGTTSMCHYLRQHPDVFVSRQKESHFFAHAEVGRRLEGPGDAEGLGRLLVTDQADYESSFRDGQSATARGEASVYYAAEPASLERALDLQPDMRFVYLVRHPTRRCLSAYGHMRRDGREPLDLSGALLDEGRRETARWSHGFGYRQMSDYPQQIEAMRAVAGADRLHVVVLEELLADAGQVMSSLFAFLGVSPVPVDTSLVMNRSGAPRSRLVNQLFVTDNAVKRGLKKVVPYTAGAAVAQRLRNRNLRRPEVPFPTELASAFGTTVTDTESLVGRPLPAWR